MGKHKHFLATHLFSNCMPVNEANNFFQLISITMLPTCILRKTGYKGLPPSLFLTHTLTHFHSLPWPFQISLLLYENFAINHSYGQNIFPAPQSVFRCHPRWCVLVFKWLLARTQCIKVCSESLITYSLPLSVQTSFKSVCKS